MAQNKKQKSKVPVIQSCKCSSDYLIDNDLENKYAIKTVDEGLVDDLLKTQDKYLDNLEVIQATSTVPDGLGLRNPKLGNVVGSLDSIQNGNKQLKPNGTVAKAKSGEDYL